MRENLNLSCLKELKLGVASSCDLKHFVWSLREKNIFKSVKYNFELGLSDDAVIEMLNPKSFVYESDVVIISIAETVRKLIHCILNETDEDPEALLKNITNNLNTAYDLAAKSDVKYIFSFDYPINNYLLGYFDAFKEKSLLFYLNRVEQIYFESILKYHGRIIPLHIREAFDKNGFGSNFIKQEIYGGHLSDMGGDQLVKLLLEKLVSMVDLPGKIKAIALDLDNTLWDGVYLESDGFPAFIDVRVNALVRHAKNGIPIFVVSKNNPEDLEVIKSHIETSVPWLARNIIGWKISWDPKSAAIKEFAKQIGISTSSIAFFDDSEFERGEVVFSKLGIKVYKELEILDSLRYAEFNFLNLSSDAKKRVEMYKTNIIRDQSDIKINATEGVQSIDDYLHSLKFLINFRKASNIDLDRVEELVQRTNQQNLLLNRTSRSQISDYIIKDKCIIIDLKDKFGDYGVIGAIIYELKSNNVVLKEMAISCRALGKKVEETILVFLNNHFEQMHSISFVYTLNDKNKNFYEILEKFGFKAEEKILSLEIKGLKTFPAWFTVSSHL